MYTLMFGDDYFGSVRVVLLEDEPFFVTEDICEILEFSENVEFLLDEEDTGVIAIPTKIGLTSMSIISKYGLFSLIMTSRIPEAKRFKRWVTSEILPTSYLTSSLKAEKMKLSQALLLTKEELEKAQMTIQSQKKHLQVAEEETLEEKKHRLFKEISEVMEEHDRKLRKMESPSQIR